MNESQDIPNYFTTKQASEILSVSQHQVAQLISAGELLANKVGGVLLADSQSVYKYAQSRNIKQTNKGRPLSSSMAFALLWELSDKEPSWLNYFQTRRMHEKLQSLSAKNLVWQCRKRCETYRCRATQATIRRIRSSVVASGTSSSTASRLSLTRDETTFEAYCSQAAFDTLRQEFSLAQDFNGNLILHACDQEFLADICEEMPEAVNALDLAESLSTRERSAGLRRLKELIDERK